MKNHTRLRWIIHICVGGAVIVVVAICGAIMQIGSLSGSMSYLRGDRLIIEPVTASLGAGDAGDIGVARFNVTNYASREAVLVGATFDCTCAGTESLPLVVPAGETREFAVNVRFTGFNGPFERKLVVFTNVSTPEFLAVSIVRFVKGDFDAPTVL